VRKLLIGAITGAVMLALAAIAFAETEQTYEQSYTKNKVSKSTGTHFKVSSIDTANTENNQQPKGAREVDISFPSGSKIDYKAAPVCKQLNESDENVCPKNTKVGSGNAEARLAINGTDPIPAKVTAFNRKKGLWLYVEPQVQGQAPVVLKPVFKGLTLKTHVDPLCVLGDCAKYGEAVLTKFELTTKAIVKGKGKRKRTFIKTPPKCPKAGWQFKSHFVYSDGTTKNLPFTQKCRK
jgi:hypothetical protein